MELAEPCLSAHSFMEGCCHNIKLKSNFLLNKEVEKIQSNDRKKELILKLRIKSDGEI